MEFLEVLANAMKTVEPEVMYSEVFANGSSARVKDNFIMKTTLLDTHAFAFQVKCGVVRNHPLVHDARNDF